MDAKKLLDCWEKGRSRHALDRALILHALAAPDQPADTLADQTLGVRNAALLRLRKALFGDAIQSCVECGECGEKLQFSLSVDAMLSRLRPLPAVADSITVSGRRLRLPTTRDLASIASEPDETHALRALFQRLRVDDCADSALPHDELARALDEADPGMDLGITLDCPECAQTLDAGFDVPAFLWEELEARVGLLLDQVHVLASAYGWDESTVLQLSDARRNAYLQRVLV